MKQLNRMFILGLWTTALLAPTFYPASAQDLLSGKALITALRRGGYNIYFRHAAIDWTQNDRVAAEGDWTSCDPAPEFFCLKLTEALSW
jgi:hypothetical protein